MSVRSRGPHVDRGHRLERWEELTAWPLLVGAVLWVALYSWIIVEPRMPPASRASILGTMSLLWMAFAADYLIRWSLSTNRWAFVRSGWFDLVSVLVPLLRPFMVVVYLAHLPTLGRRVSSTLRIRFVTMAGAFATIFVYTAAITVLAVERGAPGASITTFGDSLWWAAVTISTVGYGDQVPVTTFGRVTAVGLMLGGVAIVGMVSAALVSFLNERIRLWSAHDAAQRTPDGEHPPQA